MVAWRAELTAVFRWVRPRPRGQTLGGDPCLSTGDTREALPARAQAHQLGRTQLKTAVYVVAADLLTEQHNHGWLRYRFPALKFPVNLHGDSRAGGRYYSPLRRHENITFSQRQNNCDMFFAFRHRQTSA